jgi:hypothetical protein
MEHSEFVRAWRAGELLVDVDRSKALAVAGSKLLPKRYQAAHLFWSWVWLLTVPAAIAVMFLYKWWVGVLILLLVTPALSRATKRSAMQFMMDHALENPDFYRLAVDQGVIRFRTRYRERDPWPPS